MGLLNTQSLGRSCMCSIKTTAPLRRSELATETTKFYLLVSTDRPTPNAGAVLQTAQDTTRIRVITK